jgi:hypothetical protein
VAEFCRAPLNYVIIGSSDFDIFLEIQFVMCFWFDHEILVYKKAFFKTLYGFYLI